MKIKRLIFAVLLSVGVVTLYQCNNYDNQSKTVIDTVYVQKTKFAGNTVSDTGAVLLADTIIYDVVVKNPNKEDEWTTECLRKFNRKALVTMVFDAVYSGKAKAFKHSDNSPLSIQDVKEIEKKNEFKRDRIARIQFEESWYFDEKNFRFGKKVNALMMGYELYDLEGNIKSYAATFRVPLNN